MKVMVKLFSLFKFSWLRRCKTCRARGAKCLCKRPSLALEHIFFLEERKNKFGARNFSHVSDTMVTAASSASALGHSLNNNNTVLLRGSSFGDEYAFADLYYTNPPANAPATPKHQRASSSASGSRGSHSSHGSARGSLDKKKTKGLKRAAPGTTTIVRKNSGRMVPAPGRRRFEELPSEYTLYSDHTTSSLGGGRRRPLRLHSTGSDAPESGSTGSSFKFYGRSGGGSSASTASTALSSGRGFGSKNDSLVLGSKNDSLVLGSKNDSLVLSSSVSSSVRMSVASDRMSVDNNFGSYNPRGMLLENGGFAASIQEDGVDDDAAALRQLSGWLQASPTSTAGSFAAPRNIHCF